jgi:hypothetical protein
MARARILLAALVAALAVTGTAQAAGGNYGFDGGTPAEQSQVTSALKASAFNWSIVPARVTVHIVRGRSNSEAAPGEIWLDADLLDSGRFSWGVVQHEYAHQVDFFLLTDSTRGQLNALLGGKAWCYGLPGMDAVASLGHAAYGCERFASTLAWAYWPSADNSMQPMTSAAESAAMAPKAFRVLMAKLVGAPDTVGVKKPLGAKRS